MLLNLITSIIMISSLSYSPLSVGVITMSYSLLMLIFIINFSSSIIVMLIFLIYIGGLMVMFSYFLSLQPNFSMDMNPMFISLIVNLLYLNQMNSPSMNMLNMSSEKISTILLISKYEILFLLTASLLFSLIIVGTMLSKFWGPMRPYN